jgi:glycosyltransferase involved in cell wall biosynthesis
VIANSHHTAERVRAAWSRQAVVCPPGVDVPAEDQWADGSGVLSVGELEPRKGFDFLVEALSLLPSDVRPPLRICANRANPLTRRRLEDQARELGVRLRIDVDPPQEELWRSYSEAAVFAYGARNEALGLAPLEAMARARPVVAVAEGGVTETVQHGCTGLLTRRDPASFASALESLLTDTDRRRVLGRQARAHVQRSWSQEARGPALEDALGSLACPASVR